MRESRARGVGWWRRWEDEKKQSFIDSGALKTKHTTLLTIPLWSRAVEKNVVVVINKLHPESGSTSEYQKKSVTASDK